MRPGKPTGEPKPDLYVIARFLDRLWTPPWEPPAEYSKAKLQLAVRLNYDLFRRYLAVLQQKGFLELVENGKGEQVVRLTPRGRQAHEELVGWIRSVFGTTEF